MTCSDWISIVDASVTALLTFIIIFQTHKLNKKQLEFEEKVNQRDVDLQKRQIQIDTFQYKREVYTNTFAVFECCNALKDFMSKLDLSIRSGREITEMFSLIQEKYIPDPKSTLWSLREAEFILPSNLSEPILKIRTCYDNMASDFISLGTIESVLTDIELEKVFPESKIEILQNAFKNCNEILSYVQFIEAALPKEIIIAGLNR